MALARAVGFKRKVLLLITGRYGIFAINFFLICLSVATLRVMIPMLFNTVDNVLELEDVSEYMGAIFVGYGVAVEERQAFMKIFKLYPEYLSSTQEYVDELCHEYGLCYLLLGLFMEICVACIKIPNSIIDTDHIEYIVFGFSAFFLIWNAVLMARHNYFLATKRPLESQTA